ncbi:hypothetical protein BH11ACT6_BH11ACT6_58140 [soil metagenome]
MPAAPKPPVGCQTEAVKRLAASLVIAALLLSTGCVHEVDGRAQPKPIAGDPDFFFGEAAPTFGQRVGALDAVRLAYLQALRRIDVCGLVNQRSLAKIGEIQSIGTLFVFDECDVEVKSPGQVFARYISATVELGQAEGPEVARVDGIAVRESEAGSCEYLVPIDLAVLPGARTLAGSEQPHLRVAMIADTNCVGVPRVAQVIAENMARSPLPARDGLAAYVAPLAERDPCEVLSVLEVGYWDISGTGPYRCMFGVARKTAPEAVPMQVSLRPRVVDVSVDGRELVRTDGVEVYLDRERCTASAFVGPVMQRRLADGSLVDTGDDLQIRPAVDVTSGEADCTGTTLAAEVAARAAALYG